MIDKNNKINDKPKIWDLHIHTCLCPKASSEFKNLNCNEYVDGIIGLFKKYPDLEMISFTDHNQISLDVYDLFNKKIEETNLNINFLIGMEVDTELNANDSKYKHIIIYMNIDKKNYLKYRDLCVAVNKKLNGNTPINITKLLEFLIELKIDFVVSPHARKQGKRGIETNWNDEDSIKIEPKKYMDAFFCFWEASGESEIAKCKEFLEEFYKDKISIIAFSDSSDFKKLENYLQNPPVYFRALPTFKGLQLVGTEPSRICEQSTEFNRNEKGNYIKKIEFENNTIEFSSKMNAIIGGRGSGKSLLLDAIANKLNSEKVESLKSNRKKFIQKKNIDVFNFNDNRISENSFHFDYFSQSYAERLFESNDNLRLKEFFSDSYNEIDDFQIEEIKEENKRAFLELLNKINLDNSNDIENISNMIEKFKLTDNEKFELDISQNEGTTEFIEFKKNKNQLVIDLNKSVPSELKDDREIRLIIDKFADLILHKIFDYNNNCIIKRLSKIFAEKIEEYNSNINEEEKNKDIVKKQFTSKLDHEAKRYIERVNVVNSLIQCSINFKKEYVNNIFVNTNDDNKKFKICKTLNIESPLEYLESNLKEYFCKPRGLNDRKECLKRYIDDFCYMHDENLRANKDSEKLLEKLKKFDLTYSNDIDIFFKNNNGEYENIKTMSPGTQSNVLMEYIVYKDTNIPLLIDQPEDNVDNFTIFNVLTNWFRKLKNKRQIIVVTHDANIVINGDAENVIVANHDQCGFTYSFGALEYNDNLEKAAKILDGGKEAVQERINKYGK